MAIVWTVRVDSGGREMVIFSSTMPRALLGCVQGYKHYSNQGFFRMSWSSEFLHILKIVVFCFKFHYLTKPKCRKHKIILQQHCVWTVITQHIIPSDGDRSYPNCWASDCELMQLVAKKDFITLSDSFKS